MLPNPPSPRRLLRLSCTEAPSLHRHYPASAVLRASPPPQRARPVPHGRPVDHPWSRVGVSRVACAFLVYMLPPLPRCSRWAYSSLKIHPSVSAFPDSTIGSACTSTFSRFAQRLLALRPAHSRSHQIRDRYPGASDISSPPCLPRLLPAGAVAGWALHPLEKRRLVTAHVDSGPSPGRVRTARLRRKQP